MADDARAAAELARLLAPGGALAVTVPAGPGRLGPTDRAAGHWRRYDRAGLTGLLAGAGLDVVEVSGWGWPFGRLYDRLVLAPAIARRDRAAGRRLARVGRWRVVEAVWCALFAVDEKLPAGEHGCGWLAVGRRGGRWTGDPGGTPADHRHALKGQVAASASRRPAPAR